MHVLRIFTFLNFVSEFSKMAYKFTSGNRGDKLLAEFRKMLFDRCLVDLTLVFDSKIIRVHKVILAASSPYFKEHLSTNDSSIVVLKSSYNAVSAIVEYIYFGTTRVPENDCKEFLSAARYFMIKELSELKIEKIGEIPEFPRPVFINEVRNAAEDVIPQANTTDTNAETPSTSKSSDDKPTYYARMPITINEPDISENIVCNPSKNVTSQKKRGRPRKNVLPKTIQDAIEKRLEMEETESTKCLEYLEELQKNDTESYRNLQLAINSISEMPNTFAFDADDQISFQLTNDQGHMWLEEFTQLGSDPNISLMKHSDLKEVPEAIPLEYKKDDPGAADPTSSTSTMIENNIMFVNEGDIIIDMDQNMDIESNLSMEIKDFIEI